MLFKKHSASFSLGSLPKHQRQEDKLTMVRLYVQNQSFSCFPTVTVKESSFFYSQKASLKHTSVRCCGYHYERSQGPGKDFKMFVLLSGCVFVALLNDLHIHMHYISLYQHYVCV